MQPKTKPQPQKAAPVKPKTVIEQIIDLVDKHIAVTDAILKDYSYATEENMDIELKTANENLKSAVEEFQDEPESADFKELVQKVRDHPDYDDSEVFKIVDLDEIVDADLLAGIDDDSATEFVKDKGFAVIDLQGNIALKDKLETFLKTEIYPNYRDQDSYIFL